MNVERKKKTTTEESEKQQEAEPTENDKGSAHTYTKSMLSMLFISWYVWMYFFDPVGVKLTSLT